MKIFRWKGILFFVVVGSLLYIGAVYFLDAYLRQTMVKQGTKINNALVDVDSLRLSFLQSRLVIKGIRATDPQDLMRNRVDVANITADFKFLPLLKKKLIIEEIKVAEVQWGTPRKSAGAVPASWRRQWEQEALDSKNSLTNKAIAALRKQVTAQLPKIDLGKLQDRFDPREWVKLEEVASYQQAVAMPDEMQKFFNDWQSKSSNFVDSQKGQISNYQAKIAALDPRQFKQPTDYVQAIQTIQGLEKEINAQKTAVANIVEEGRRAVDEKVNQVKQLRDNFEKDVEALKNKIAFKDLDIKQLSQSIFGPIVINSYAKYLPYYDRMRAVMGAMKSKKEPKPERWRGRNIPFPITDATPRFLLAKLELSSDTRSNQGVDAAYRGFYKLAASSISSDPVLVGKPMLVALNAEMVESLFKRADLQVSIDRTKVAAPHDRVEFSVQSVKIGSAKLGDDDFFVIPLAGGAANLRTLIDIRDEQLQANIKAELMNLKYDFPAPDKDNLLEEIIQEVVVSLKQFDVEAGIKGKLDEPDLNIRSSFDDAVHAGIKKVLAVKLEKARAELEAYARKEIGAKIAVAEKLLNEKKGEAMSLLNKQMQSVNELQKLAQTKLDEVKKQQTGNLQKELQKNLPKLPVDKVKIPKLPF